VVELWAMKMPKIDWIRNHISLADTLLDIGCSDKGVWEHAPYKPTTVDINPAWEPDIVADAHSLPFEDNSYDVVTITEILEHVKDDKKCLSEAYRIARKKVIITVPWEEMWTEEFGRFKNPDHIRYYTPDGFRELLMELGLVFSTDIIKWGGFMWIGVEIYKRDALQSKFRAVRRRR